MPAKNPLEERRLKQEKARKEAEKTAKLAALSEREIQKRHKAKEVRDRIRAERLAREAAEVVERQQAYKEQRAETAASALRQREHQQRQVLKELGQKAQCENELLNPETPTKRAAIRRGRIETGASPNTVVRPLSPSVNGPVTPSLDELRTDSSYTVDAMPFPDEDTIASLATMRVLYADATHGMGMWAEGSKRYARPDGWWPTIEELNRGYTYYGQTDKNIMMGEYNAVFINNATTYCTDLPTLLDPDGVAYDLDDLVLRITRPDVEVETGETVCRHRYKTLQEQADELYYTLHGAANGYAVPCIAAMIFAGPKVRRKGKLLQLYGSLYVLKKAPVTLTNVLEDHVKHVASSKGFASNSVELAPHLHRGARKCALRVLPVLVRQAMLGGLYFDCKPANTLFVDGSNIYLSDFDASMYSIMRTDGTSWEAHLLVSLLLLSTHIRCYHPRGIGEGWGQAFKYLLLDLSVAARTSTWLMNARVRRCTFVPSRVSTVTEATARLEMMVSAYFCDPTRAQYFKNNPRFDTSPFGKPLLNQMLKYVITGSAVSTEASVRAALGEV